MAMWEIPQQPSRIIRFRVLEGLDTEDFETWGVDNPYRKFLHLQFLRVGSCDLSADRFTSMLKCYHFRLVWRVFQTDIDTAE